DLVTMRWWDDLWLNEGFASWMQGRTTEKLHPEWNSALSKVQSRDRAMVRDALATTHPVVQHIETVEQASQAFDTITYSKGEAVIRMLEGYVGADAWRDGVRHYIKVHAYGNTVSDDLWRAIESTAGKPIIRIAHDFTLQPGVPMIRVEQARCDGDHTELLLRQSEFSQDHPAKTPLAWEVPVIAQTLGSRQQARTLVSGGKATSDVPGCGTVVVNAGQSGYFRTLYAPQQFAAIESDFAKLAPIDQLGILDDTFALDMAGLAPASGYLELAQAMPVDADPQVWGGIAATFASLDDNYRNDPQARVTFRAFAIKHLAPVFARIGWIAKTGEPDPVKNLRNMLIETLGALGDADVIAEARRRFEAQATDPEALPAALRKTIIGVVARHADVTTWDRLHAAAIAEKTPLVKDDLYSELSSSEDATLAQRVLDLSLTDEPGATNSARMISSVAELHPDLAFDFAVVHREQVDAKVDSTSRSRYYPSLASNSLDPAMINKLNAFAGAHIAATSRRVSDTAIATIEYRIKVRNERLPAMDAWLQKSGN
ncbi:MAG: M1 family metallopeptidase, partial [Lysobacteraceae bacterium]